MVGRREAVALDLHLHLVLLLHVQVPGRVLGRAALGGDEDVAVAVRRVDERHGPRFPRLAPGRGQQQDRGPALPGVAALAVGLAVGIDVFLAEEVVVAHAAQP